jgi:hypothetical protein
MVKSKIRDQRPVRRKKRKKMEGGRNVSEERITRDQSLYASYSQDRKGTGGSKE